MRYQAIDYYEEEPEILVNTDDLNEAYDAVIMRMADTDGDCDIMIKDNSVAPFPGGSVVPVYLWGEEED